MSSTLVCGLLLLSAHVFGVNVSPNIIGGLPSATDAPWMVSLNLDENEELAYCGGTLVHAVNTTEQKETVNVRGLVVSSASCLDNNILSKAILGKYNLKDEKSGTILKINHTCIHKDYNRLTNENDIALFQVDFVYEGKFEDIHILDYSRSVDESLYPYTMSKVYGWGVKTESGPLQTQLQTTSISLFNDKDCASFYSHESFKPAVMLCAGGNDKGPCSYDTGGPLVCESMSGGEKTLCGIISFGSGCASTQNRLPSIFTDVKYFKGWITEVIDGNKSNCESSN